MKKKIVSMVLCVGMILSMMACGSTGQGEEGRVEASKTTQTVQTENSNDSTQEKVDEPPVTITVEVFDRGNMTEEYGTPIDNKWVDLFKEVVMEELNIDLQYVAIPRTEETTKLQALMSAGKEPDIFYTYSADRFIEWANQGILADLSEYMDTEEGKSITEYLGGEEIVEYGAIGEAQYAICAPSYVTGNASCFVRKDLLEQVGVDLDEVNGHYVIKPSELEDALIKIKSAGLCDYPMWVDVTRASGDDVYAGSFITEITDEIKVKGPEFDDGYKEYYRYMNRCYNEGLIHPDFALYDTTGMNQMISSGQVAFWEGNYWLYISEAKTLYESQPDAEIVAVELIHENGDPAYFITNYPHGAYGMVSSNCENVEAAFKLINWFMTSETAHMLAIHGIEGEHFEYQDGEIAIIDVDYNKKDRISVKDLDLYMNEDPCKNTIENYQRIYAIENKDLDERVLAAFCDAQNISMSEGKYSKPAINVFIQSQSDYSVEISENRTNLLINSLAAPIEKFDNVFDSYFEIYMENGLEQVANDKWEAYNEQH